MTDRQLSAQKSATKPANKKNARAPLPKRQRKNPVITRSKRRSRRRRDNRVPGQRVMPAPAAIGFDIHGTPPRMASLSKGRIGIKISHCEMAFNVTPGATQLGIDVIEDIHIAPSNPLMFPWLSRIAQAFQQYNFTKLKFHYVPSSGTQTEGRVALVWDALCGDDKPERFETLLEYQHRVMGAPYLSHTLDTQLGEAKPFNTHFVPIGTEADGNGNVGTNEKLLNFSGRLVIGYNLPTANKDYGVVMVEYSVELINPAPSTGLSSSPQGAFHVETFAASTNNNDPFGMGGADGIARIPSFNGHYDNETYNVGHSTSGSWVGAVQPGLYDYNIAYEDTLHTGTDCVSGWTNTFAGGMVPLHEIGSITYQYAAAADISDVDDTPGFGVTRTIGAGVGKVLKPLSSDETSFMQHFTYRNGSDAKSQGNISWIDLVQTALPMVLPLLLKPKFALQQFRCRTTVKGQPVKIDLSAVGSEFIPPLVESELTVEVSLNNGSSYTSMTLAEYQLQLIHEDTPFGFQLHPEKALKFLPHVASLYAKSKLRDNSSITNFLDKKILEELKRKQEENSRGSSASKSLSEFPGPDYDPTEKHPLPDSVVKPRRRLDNPRSLKA